MFATISEYFEEENGSAPNKTSRPLRNRHFVVNLDVSVGVYMYSCAQ